MRLNSPAATRWLFLSLAMVLSLTGSAEGQTLFATNDALIVDVGSNPFHISTDELLENDTGESGSAPVIASTTLPHHGTLVAGLDYFEYIPNPEFWAIGTDSFTYQLSGGISGRTNAVATVILQAGLKATLVSSMDFETLPLDEDWSISGNAARNAKGALIGNYGLLTEETGDAYITAVAFAGQGNGQHGSGSRMTIRPPKRPPTETGNYFPEVIFAGGVSNDPLNYKVRLFLEPTGTTTNDLHAEIIDDFGVPHQTQPISIGAEPVSVRMVWWSSQPGIKGGLSLIVDEGETKSVDDILLTSAEASHFHYGFTDFRGVSQTSTLLDELEVWAYEVPDDHSAWTELRKVDGFESGTLANWIPDNPAQTQAKPSAALAGNWGLEASLPNNRSTEGYGLLDLTPTNDLNQSARFQVDFSQVSLGEGGFVSLLTGLRQESPAAGKLFTVQVEKVNGQLQLRGLSSGTDADGNNSTPTLPVNASGPQTVTVQWRGSGGNGFADGYLRIWVDSQVVGLDQINDGGSRLEALRIGALTRSVNSEGAVLFDSIETWTHP